jgi:peptidoglycan hydrolase-like protein with peptidoglycan-binding domain
VKPIYPVAAWRPLSNQQTEPSIGTPRLLIWHTMVGYLKSTESMFRQGGYSGTESTWGLGGRWDGAGLDGAFWQWQRCDYQADAQFAGNAYANSIECSDGGDAAHPFSDKQIAASVALGVWWCRQTGHAPVPATAWNAAGFGYHRMFREWNQSNHDCPGNVRVRQLETEIWPEIAAQLNQPPIPPLTPPFPLPAGWYFGPQEGPRESVSGYHGHATDLARWQRQMRARGWTINLDGHYTDVTHKVTLAFQTEKGLTVDGLIGPRTWAAAWTLAVS